MSNRISGWIKAVLILLVPIVLAFAMVYASQKLENGQESENLKQLESSIRKAVVTCYATEGVYPPSIQYLKDNYGIQIDEDKYVVLYEIFGSNIMPQITVDEA